MLRNNIKKIELEITSDCNAACPGCARTLNVGKYKIKSFGLKEIQRIFPLKENIQGKMFKFCGVLGDPAKNFEMVDMIDYLTENNAYCEVSTNGGIQSADWWARLGEISRARPGLVHVHWCVDGFKETNHIYRVNTSYKIIDRNMVAFAENASEGSGQWVYIVFDHNEYELDAAYNRAKELGFTFSTRTGMRNSYNEWMSNIQKRDKATKKINTENYIITTTGKKEHSKIKEIEELDKFIESSSTKQLSEEQIKEVTDTIVCKFVHEGEIFIASNLTVWPCCFLWDSTIRNKDGILDKLNSFDLNWNSLIYYNIDEIISHPWYTEVLESSWNPYHNKHVSRCIRTCAKNKAYHNEFTKISTE